jgi:kynurenine formamidase
MKVNRIAAPLTLAALLLCGCESKPPAPAPSAGIDKSKVVDLTYVFDSQTVNWPTAQPFHWEKETWGMSPKGYWYAAGRYAGSEHLGTHLDSPIHFAKDGATADQIPVTSLIGPADVIDVTAACEKDADYRVTPGDITAWEKLHGTLAAGAIAVFRTGWGSRWPDKKRYLGSDVPGDISNLHFPGLSGQAARLLVERKVEGIAIDTASMDYGQSKDFIVHQVLTGAGIYGLENLANAERLPPAGATLIAMPMKIAGASGAPTRIIALLP